MPRVYLKKDYNHVLNPKNGTTKFFQGGKVHVVKQDVADKVVELGIGELEGIQTPAMPTEANGKDADKGKSAFTRRVSKE